MDEDSIVAKRSKMKGCSSGLERMSKAMDILLSENSPVEKVKDLKFDLSKIWSDCEREYADIDMFRTEERLALGNLFDRTKIDYLELVARVQKWLATKVTPSSASGRSSQSTALSAIRSRQLLELELEQAKRRQQLERRRLELRRE